MNDPSAIKLVSHSFNASLKGRYQLSIGIADGTSSCALLDVSAKRYEALFETRGPFHELVEVELSNLEPISVSAFIKGGPGTLVPVGSFTAGNARNILALTQSAAIENEVLHEAVPALPLEMLYSPDTESSDLLKKYFPQVRILDARTVFLNGIARGASTDAQLHLQVWEREFDIAIFNEGALQLFNKHYFNSAEDVLYHCLFALDRTKVDRNKVKLTISGNSTGLFDLMSKYFEKPFYSEGQDLLEIAPELNTRAYHLNHLLYELYLCA